MKSLHYEKRMILQNQLLKQVLCFQETAQQAVLILRKVNEEQEFHSCLETYLLIRNIENNDGKHGQNYFMLNCIIKFIQRKLTVFKAGLFSFSPISKQCTTQNAVLMVVGFAPSLQRSQNAEDDAKTAVFNLYCSRAQQHHKQLIPKRIHCPVLQCLKHAKDHRIKLTPLPPIVHQLLSLAQI